MLGSLWCCGDTDAPVASDGTYGRECWFYSHFYVGKAVAALACQRFALACGCGRLWSGQNHTRGRFYASKRSKDNHFLGAFEIAEHLER